MFKWIDITGNHHSKTNNCYLSSWSMCNRYEYERWC